MCEPVTAMAAGGAVLSAGSAYGQVKAANQASELNAQILGQNAALADQKADITAERGKNAEKTHRLKISKLKGEQRAAFASSGVVVDTGSSLDVLIDTAKTEELDAAQIKRNTAINVWKQKAEATNFRNQATLSRAKKQSAGLAAGASLLGGLGSALG